MIVVFAVIAVMFVPVVYGLWQEWHRQRGIEDLDPLSDDWKPWNAVDETSRILRAAREQRQADYEYVIEAGKRDAERRRRA